MLASFTTNCPELALLSSAHGCLPGPLYIPPTLPPGVVVILSQFINTKRQKPSTHSIQQNHDSPSHEHRSVQSTEHAHQQWLIAFFSSWQHHKVDAIIVHIGRCRNGSWGRGQSVGTMAGAGIWILAALCSNAWVYLLPPADQIVWVVIPRLSFPKSPWFSGDLCSDSEPQAIR